MLQSFIEALDLRYALGSLKAQLNNLGLVLVILTISLTA